MDLMPIPGSATDNATTTAAMGRDSRRGRIDTT
jgi:hypothetical protein